MGKRYLLMRGAAFVWKFVNVIVCAASVSYVLFFQHAANFHAGFIRNQKTQNSCQTLAQPSSFAIQHIVRYHIMKHLLPLGKQETTEKHEASGDMNHL